MRREVTLADIANAAGTSIVTVSNALNGRRGVSSRMREKIAALADSMGYEPKRGGKPEERSRQSYSFGVLIPERYVENYPSYYMDLYQKIVLESSRQDCFVLLELYGKESEEQGKLPELFSDAVIAGVLCLGQMKKSCTEALRAACRVPIVFVDFYEDLPDTDFVISNGFYGMYQVTCSLIREGITRIGYLGSIGSTSSILDRYCGYRKALQEKQLSLREDWLIPDRDDWGKWCEFVLPEEMPEAFVCNCDEAAVRLIWQLEEMGLRVPDDISVAGFDHYQVKEPPVPLVTWDSGMQGMAETAVSVLLKKIHGLTYQKGIRVIEGYFVDGCSIRRSGSDTRVAQDVSE